MASSTLAKFIEVTGWKDADFIKHNRINFYSSVLFALVSMLYLIFKFLHSDNNFLQGRIFALMTFTVLFIIALPGCIREIKHQKKYEDNIASPNSKSPQIGNRSLIKNLLALMVFLAVILLPIYLAELIFFKQGNYLGLAYQLSWQFYAFFFTLFGLGSAYVLPILFLGKPSLNFQLNFGGFVFAFFLFSEIWMLIPAALVHKNTMHQGEDVTFLVTMRSINSETLSKMDIIDHSQHGLSRMNAKIQLDHRFGNLNVDKVYAVRAKVGALNDVLINAESLRTAVPITDAPPDIHP